MAYVPPSDSVVAFQSKPSSLLVGASIIGLTPVNVVNNLSFNPSSVYILNPVSTLSVNTNVPTPSYISYQLAGSVLAVSGSFSANAQASINALQLAGSVLAVNMPSPSVIAYQAAGSIMAVSGSFTANPQASINALQLAGSVLAVNMPSPSVIAYQLAGSIMAVSATVNTGNSSVQLVPGFATIGSVAAFQGGTWVMGPSSVYVVNPVSTLTINSTSGPSSVQLLVGQAVIGSVAVLQATDPWKVNVPTPSFISIQPAGSVQAVRTDNASVIAVLSNSSVAVLQGTDPWKVNVPTPSYIAYQLAGSIMAVSATVNTGNSSVQLVPGFATIGSVAAFQGGLWATSVSGVGLFNVNHTGNGSVVVVGQYTEKSSAGNASVIGVPFLFKSNATTSVLATVSDLNPLPVSVQGTLTISNPNSSVVVNNILTGVSSVQLLTGIGVIGSVAVLQGTSPWLITGSVAVLEPGGVRVTSVVGTYQEKAAAGQASVVGFPIMFKSNNTTSVLAVPSSADPLPIIGSVAALQGTNPWIVNPANSSIITIIQQGNSSVTGTMSVLGTVPVTFAGGYSIVGTYAEDSAHATADKGLLSLNVRNDTLSSITSTDADYSPWAMGPAGEGIVANAPITKWVSGTGSVMNGTSIQVIAAPGTSIFTYITGINVVNESAVTARVTITQGRGAVVASMLTWVIAPGAGGSNSTYPNGLRVLDNNGISASISAAASVYVTITGFNAKI
jgi:hypothetical protein